MGATTEGRIAMSVPAEILPDVVKALRKNRGVILKGPNEAVLNFIGSVPRDQIDSFLRHGVCWVFGPLIKALCDALHSNTFNRRLRVCAGG
jgi:hypothetical protein